MISNYFELQVSKCKLQLLSNYAFSIDHGNLFSFFPI